MIDLLGAIWGGKHCGWCVCKQATRWERLMRHDQIVDRQSMPWWERASEKWTDISHMIGIWKLGQAWHFKFHSPIVHHNRFKEE